MWRCVWPFRATYMVQLVSVAVNSNKKVLAELDLCRWESVSNKLADSTVSRTISIWICRCGFWCQLFRFALCLKGSACCWRCNTTDLFVWHWLADSCTTECLVFLFLRNACRQSTVTICLCISLTHFPVSICEHTAPLSCSLLASQMDLADFCYLSPSQRLTLMGTLQVPTCNSVIQIGFKNPSVFRQLPRQSSILQFLRIRFSSSLWSWFYQTLLRRYSLIVCRSLWLLSCHLSSIPQKFTDLNS